MDISLRIFRGIGPITGSRDEEFSDFHFTAKESDTILDLLMKAGLEDASLLFRHSCHHGSCGTCACIIDGTERLACRTSVSEFQAASRIEIRPLNGFPRIRDLVVDMSPLFEKTDETWPYLRRSERDGRRFEDCIECGACMSACPVTEPFQGPAPLAFLHRRLESLDAKAEEERKNLLSRAGESDAVPACQEHFACSRVCPQRVAPGRRIRELRNLL